MDFAIGRRLQTLLRGKSLNVMIQTTTIQSGNEFAEFARLISHQGKQTANKSKISIAHKQYFCLCRLRYFQKTRVQF